MVKNNILVVDDEEDILELVSYNLNKEGFNVETVTSGEEVLNKVISNHTDLIILDLMLPGINGLKVCKSLKQDELTKNIPILMLTAKSSESDIVTGLEIGADDYITKPFSPKVLVARVKTILRREENKHNDTEELINIFDLTINPNRHEVLLKGKVINLTINEFKILQLLASNPGRVFSRFQIIDSVKGIDHLVTERSVDVVIVGLRKRLGECSNYIETVRGVGYRFKD